MCHGFIGSNVELHIWTLGSADWQKIELIQRKALSQFDGILSSHDEYIKTLRAK